MSPHDASMIFWLLAINVIVYWGRRRTGLAFAALDRRTIALENKLTDLERHGPYR